ncbi:hypothetical protein HPB49_018510 [Dermacentor silvarum]|uniref:Uncharacterized protein n=1 Tax=Dermacentor silvarum TaxID=543639 RepID=A0ACB8CGZ2_DERSI|nr:hypothetical protein HPB49_018510 [Dermacentor silvarum]
MAEYLNATLNWTKSPCKDFYGFVCDRFNGPEESVVSNTEEFIKSASKALLLTIDVPPRNQTATEKAAGLFQACVRLANNGTATEAAALRSFLRPIGLDVSNMAPDPNFIVLERMAQLSMEYGFPSLVKFNFFRRPNRGKRYQDMKIFDNDMQWIKTSHQEHTGPGALATYYEKYLKFYDSNLNLAALTRRIIAVEKASEWVRIYKKFTNDTFDGKDTVVLWNNATAVVVFASDTSRLAREEARLLMAWSVLRRLVVYSSGRAMKRLQTEDLETFCLDTVSGVLEVAVTNRYITTYAPQRALEAAKVLTLRMISELVNKLSNTRWIVDPVRNLTVTKARSLQLIMAYPPHLENASKLEEFYSTFPDTGVGFLRPYLETHRHFTSRMFKENATENFTTGVANAYYQPGVNTMTIQAGVVQPPMYFPDGPAALNYGGLGQVVGHEIMHGYDVMHITFDKNAQPVNFKDASTMKEFERKILCLRNAYETSINKDRFSIACYRALPTAMDQLEEEWRPPTLDDPWRLQLWPYRPHSPIVWFAQVDAQLYVNGVSSQLWRYLLLKREIPTDVFSRLDLPSSDQNMYEDLKTAFFRHFGVPVPHHLCSTTLFPSTADASEGMAQTTPSSSPSAPGERCATARESSAAPTPQEPLCGDNTTTASPASRSFPDDEQPPATLPAPSTTQLVSPLVLSNDHLASTPEHTKESACTPPPPELHVVPNPSRGDDSAASRALTAVGTHISPPVPSEILRQRCGETGPAAITCTALPSNASFFPVKPLSPAPSRNTRYVSRLQRPNDTALTFGHKDASSACGARRRRTRAQGSRQPRCFAGFRRCVHPILHRCQAGRCYRALRKRPPSTPSLCSRVRLTFTRWHHANYDRANRVPSLRACHHGRSISGGRIRCCYRRRRTPPPSSPLDQPKLGRCHRGCRVPRTLLRSSVHADRPGNICTCSLEREWRRVCALRDAGIMRSMFFKLPPPKPRPLLHSQARPP